MTTPNPITPPPDLTDKQVGEWLIDDGYPWEPSEQAVITITTSRLKNVARKAFQAGADQELEACFTALDEINCQKYWSERLRAARRPKPQTLSSIALQMLGTIERDAHYLPEITDTIRRALEALPE
jgi:hypothetical protein